MQENDRVREIEGKIYTTFAEVASSIGYSPLHGKILAALFVGRGEMALEDIAKKTGYSKSMISLSVDFLEVLSVIKKVKKTGDRKLYVRMITNLLEALKQSLLVRVKKSIDDSIRDFDSSRRELESLKGDGKEDLIRAIKVLDGEIKRLDKYVGLLSSMKLP